MARNYAAVFHEYLEEMEELTDEEFGRLVRALLRYSAYGEAPEGLGNERFYIKRIISQENRCQEHYEQISRMRSQAGKKGAESRWQNRDPDSHAADGKHGKHGNTKTNTKTKNKTNLSSSTSADVQVMEEALRLKQWCQRVEEEREKDTSKITMDSGTLCP